MRAEAESGFQALIKQNPREAVIYETYGTLLLDSAFDDATEARAVVLLKTAVTLDNASAESHFQLGNLLLKKGMIEVSGDSLRQARDHLELAVRLEPSESKIHYALARLYRRLGRGDDGAKEMRLYQDLKSEEDRANPRQTALGKQSK
jgi:Tfp pilus assembly protein PilF